MDMKLILFVVWVLATCVNGQWDTPYETGIGFIDGRRVTLDDMGEQRLRGRQSQNLQDMAPRGIGGRRQVSGMTHDLFGPFSQNRLRQCRAPACSLQFIPARCRYTPVLQSGFGNLCLGCPEDVCETQRRLTPRQRRRRRRMRRRLCRNFGICLSRRSGINSLIQQF